jgi:Predicted aminopeptidases
MKKLIAISILVVSFTVSNGQTTDSLIISQLYNSALTSTTAYKNLQILTKEAPQRLAGSPGSFLAIKILYNQLKAFDPDTIYLQPVTAYPWDRGEKEVVYATLKNGDKFPMHSCALGGSVGTGPNGISAQIVEVRSFDELKTLGPDKVKGKIVFFNAAIDPIIFNPGEGYGKFVYQRVAGASEAAKYGAVAALVRSVTNQLDTFPHTGIMHYSDTSNKIPALAISTVDANKLSALLKENPETYIFVRNTSKDLPPINSFNVIAELRGSEKPNEIITAGGHIDCWELGDGANDDGIGLMHVMDIIRIYKSCDITPKRTIRIVLFIDEEMHQVGAKAYAASVKEKGEKIYVALESDSGADIPKGVGLSASAEQFAVFTKVIKVLQSYDIYQVRNGGGGTDVSFLKPLGVPTMSVIPSPQRYFEFHHNAKDTFDKIDLRQLQIGCATNAALVYLVDQNDIMGK